MSPESYCKHTQNRNIRDLEGKSGRALTKAPGRARYLAEERRRKFAAGPRTAQRTRTPRRWCRPGSSLISEESRTARSRAEEQKHLRLNNPSARLLTAHDIKSVLIKHPDHVNKASNEGRSQCFAHKSHFIMSNILIESNDHPGFFRS